MVAFFLGGDEDKSDFIHNLVPFPLSQSDTHH